MYLGQTNCKWRGHIIIDCVIISSQYDSFTITGEKPSKENGTYLEFIPSDKGASNTLGAYIESYDKRGVNIAIVTPPTSPVGKWEMHIDLVQRYNNKPTVFRHTHNDPVYILFNPWCEGKRSF